jgi:cytochrome c oxidase subunit 2
MNLGFPLFPEQASAIAPRVDALFYFLVAVSVFFVAVIFFVIVVFAVKYRRR